MKKPPSGLFLPAAEAPGEVLHNKHISSWLFVKGK